ncbi:MAG: hypothetical protein ACREMG_05785, partial [Gemmatimonadales bacterium]
PGLSAVRLHDNDAVGGRPIRQFRIAERAGDVAVECGHQPFDRQLEAEAVRLNTMRLLPEPIEVDPSSRQRRPDLQRAAPRIGEAKFPGSPLGRRPEV